MLLIYVQAPINAPRQREDKQDHIHHDADKSSSVSLPVTKPTTEFIPVFQAPKWEPKNDPTEQKPNYWKEAFGPANLSNWALVVVGGIAGCLAWLTLRAISKQIDLVIKKERARIAIEVAPHDLTFDRGALHASRHSTEPDHVILLPVADSAVRAVDLTEGYSGYPSHRPLVKGVLGFRGEWKGRRVIVKSRG